MPKKAAVAKVVESPTPTSKDESDYESETDSEVGENVEKKPVRKTEKPKPAAKSNAAATKSKYDKYLMYFMTAQASSMKTLTEALKEVLTDINIRFDEDGFEVINMDPSQISFVALKLIGKKFEEYHISEEDLLEISKGTITENGVRKNINVGILYIESWLMGVGAAALYNLMEDAATAEISRTQIWQWLKNEAKLEDGRTLMPEMVLTWQEEELEKIKNYVGEERYNNGKFELATELFDDLILNDNFAEFLTLKAYQFL